MNRTRVIAFLLALAAAPAGASHVELLSRVAPGQESATASGASLAAAISADGRYVAFVSDAVNLSPGITNPGPGRQLFLYDRATGTSTLVSHKADSPDVAGNDTSWGEVSISANGRFVAFTSYATDLVPGQEDTNGASDIFVWDRVTGATELVSRADGTRTRTGNNVSYQMTISANGRYVAFTSQASDLVDGFEDPTPFPSSDVFLWDRRTGEVLPVSRSATVPDWMADSGSGAPSISADGRYVAFLSQASDLVAGFTDRNGANDADLFVWDRTTGKSVLVSHAATNPLVSGNASSDLPRISADGRFVAFASSAADLVPRQGGPAGPNIFLWSRQSGQVVLVSHSRSSLTEGVGVRDAGFEASNPPFVSADGAWVLFSSFAPNVVRNQGESTGSSLDVFLWSRATGKIVMASRPSTNGSPSVRLSGLSSDGAWVLYTTTGNLQVSGVTDDNNREDVFLWDRRTGKRTLVSFSGASPTRTGGGGSLGAFLSADGRWIAFTTLTADLAPGDLNRSEDVVLQSRNGEREIVSLHAEGLASATPPGRSAVQSIDASGRFVLFTSTADAGLLVPGVREANRVEDLFLYDRQLDTIQLITRSADDPGATVNSNVGGSLRGQLSADGRFVAFLSNAKDVTAAAPRRALVNKVYLWDRTTGQTVWIAGFFYGSQSVAISADGSAVAFDSREPGLVPGQVDTPGTLDVFVWERSTGTKTLVSRAAGTENVAAGVSSPSRLLLSADGRIVAYTSEAANLVAGTDAPGQDVFLFDRATGTTTLASGGVAVPATVFGRFGHDLSDDGRFVLFESHTENDAGGTFDLYLYDRIAGTTVLVTHAAGSPTTPAGTGVGTGTASLSADGRFAAFLSTAKNLLSGGETPPGPNVFVFDRETGAIELISRAVRTVPEAPSGNRSSDPVISADGRRVAFVSNRPDLAPGLTGQQTGVNLFVHDRVSRLATLVSHSFEDPNRMSDGQCGLHVLNANGTVTAFSCSSTDLVPGDFNRLAGPLSDAFAAVIP